MSHVVRTAVRRHSRATRATLAILKELADFAHHDGITWISQEALSKETTFSVREVREAVRWLERMVELETRKAQRGRRRINVYRVVVGPIGSSEPAYDRLPFDLDEPFSRPAEIAARREALDGIRVVRSDGAAPLNDDRQLLPPADEASEPDDRQSRGLTTGSLTRARGTDPSREEPSETEESSDEASSVPPADAAGEREGRVFELELALSAEVGGKPITRSERGAWARAIAELADAGADGEAVTVRCAEYRRRWPEMALTPLALVRHWTLLGAAHEARKQPLVGPERWVDQTGWQCPDDVAVEILTDHWGLTDEQAQPHLARCQELRAERRAADSAVRQAFEEARVA